MIATAGDDSASDVKPAPAPSEKATRPAETPVTSLTLPAPGPEPYPGATTKPAQVSVQDGPANAATMTTASDDSASDVKAAPVPSDDAVRPAETPVTSLTPSGPAPEPLPVATTEPLQMALEPAPAEPPPQASPAPASEREEAADPAAMAAAGDDAASDFKAAPAADFSVIRDCPQCPELVVIPAGSYLMGSSPGEQGHQPHESPQHKVAIGSPFAIGRYEITFLEWDMCVREGGCQHPASDEGWGRGNRPAINVSWQDVAEQFLPWLARKSGKSYRLPSEAEWEYAVRAGVEGSRGAAFGIASQAGDLCGYANAAEDATQGTGTAWKGSDCSDGFANTAPVGSFKPNPWGLHDLAGNVWEWVADCWNESYGSAPSDGSAWTSGDCGLRVVRGGSWSTNAEKARAADRGWNRPDGRSASIGFRIARNL